MKELLKINEYLFRYKWRILLGFIFVALQNYFRVLIPPEFRKAIDLATEYLSDESNTGLNSDTVFSQLNNDLFLYALKVLGLALILGFFLFMMRQTIIKVSRLIEYDLRRDIFDHYQILDATFYNKNKTGDLMSRITEDVSKVRMYLGPALLYFLNLITLFVAAITLMYNVNPTLTFYALLPMPFLSVSIYVVSTYINSRSEKIQIQLAKLTAVAQETFSGISVIKSYAKEFEFRSYFKDQTLDYKEKSMNLARVNAIFQPLMLLMVSCSVLLVVLIGGQQVAAGIISHGNIAEFIIYVTMLTWPFTAIGWIVSIVQQAEASQKRINEFLMIKPAIIDHPNPKTVNFNGDIQFKNVYYTYGDKDEPAINNVTFEVKKGQKLGIIGKTASGKSTLCSLLLRMYDVDGGQILIDGVNIKDIDLNKLRQNIGYVPQDNFLFSDTISNNIAFGVENSDIELTMKMAKNASVHDDIMTLPKQYNTRIGERGVALSGGQKQRISIARALIKSPQILILDDCLSAVDTDTEKKILNHLNLELKNKTSIIVTHRIYNHLKFDKIIVLNRGSIEEQGSPEELFQNKGYYYEMVMRQQYEENEEHT